MTEQANRIDWLERQLAQVNKFIDRDTDILQATPDRFSVQLALTSWKTRQEELQQELRQAKSALLHEVVEMRLMGARMDGSIPLKLLSKLAEKFNSALAHAAYHLRHGTGPKSGIPKGMAQEIDLRLSGLSFGSTRLIFAGNIAPDTTGESAMEGALEQIFDVLASPANDHLRDLITVIGVPATRALSDMLGALEKQSIGAELIWPAANSKVYKWGGSLDAVRGAHKKLSAYESLKPVLATLSGRIIELKESGAIYIKDDHFKFKISYNRQQYTYIQKYTLGMQVEFKTMKYLKRDPLTEKEIATYKLVT